VANYILDFYCPSEKLAIELDGQGHFETTQAEYDRERDLFLNHCGIKVLRFENKVVYDNPEGLLENVKNEFGWVNHPDFQAAHLDADKNHPTFQAAHLDADKNHPTFQAPLLDADKNHPTFQAPLLEKEGNVLEMYENVPGFCHAATLAEVQKQDYKLTPGIYVGSEAELDDGIPFEEKMEGLKAKLNEQFEKSNDLQERIKENLEKI